VDFTYRRLRPELVILQLVILTSRGVKVHQRLGSLRRRDALRESLVRGSISLLRPDYCTQPPLRKTTLKTSTFRTRDATATRRLPCDYPIYASYILTLHLVVAQ
jgi:hypothetical protein